MYEWSIIHILLGLLDLGGICSKKIIFCDAEKGLNQSLENIIEIKTVLCIDPRNYIYEKDERIYNNASSYQSFWTEVRSCS